MKEEDPEAAVGEAGSSGADTGGGVGTPAEDAQPEPVQHRKPVQPLGAIGCLTMALAAVAGIALLSTGSFWAGAAGIVIVAVAIGVGLWLYTIASLEKK